MEQRPKQWRAPLPPMNGYQQQQLTEMKQQLALSTSAQQQTALTLGRIEDRLKDVVDDLNGKVGKDVYDGTLARMNDRLLRLESGPQRFLQWAALGVSALALLMTILAALGGVVVFIVTHP